MHAVRRQLVDSFRAFEGIYRNRSLRRLQLAWVGSSIGNWGYVVALMVYAYDHGGPGAVGLVGVIRWFPAALAAPFAGMVGDRFPRLRVMTVSDLLRMTALAIAAVVVALDAPAALVYVLAIVATVISQVFQPAQAALLPTLAESPEQLAAANVVSSTIEYVGYFVGPALGGVGYLNAALGVGGLIGGIAAAALVGVRRLALIFGLAMIVWGAPILGVGLWPEAVPALILIGIAGLGMTLGDIAGYTLLQRMVHGDVLARVFGVARSAFYAAGGLGAILAPVLVDAIGIRATLVFSGAVLPAVTIPTLGILSRIDRTITVPKAQPDRLLAIEMFAPLPAPTLELLASSLERISVPAGETVFRQGDHGDHFYIVDSGEIEIEIDGRVANVLEPGDHFGEIALLRDISRTATARARRETRLYALERDIFLSAITGHAASVEAAETVVVARLGLT